MSTKKCGHSKPCGCEDTPLTTNPPCGDGPECNDPNPCTEVFDASCIYYTQDSIECDTDEVVTSHSTVSQALSSIVEYFCTKTSNLDVCNATYLDSDPTSGDLFPICRNGELGTIDYQDLLSGLNDDLDQMQWNLINVTPHSISGTQDEGLIVNQNSINFELPATASLGRTLLIVGTNQGTTHTVTHANPSFFIQNGAVTTTPGVTGSLTIDGEDTVELTYTGLNRWIITRFHNPSGNPLILV